MAVYEYYSISRKPKKDVWQLKDKIVKEYVEDALSTSFLAKKYGTSPPTIVKILKASGVKVSKKEIWQRRLKKVLPSMCKDYFERGYRQRDLAEKYGLSEITIRKWLKECDQYDREKMYKIHSRGECVSLLEEVLKSNSLEEVMIKRQLSERLFYKKLRSAAHVLPKKFIRALEKFPQLKDKVFPSEEKQEEDSKEDDAKGVA